MTKRDLVLRVAGKTGIPQSDVARIVDVMFETLSAALQQGLRWELRDFGVFEVKTRASRVGRNPRTGDTVPVPRRRVVTFHPGKLMKDLIAKAEQDAPNAPEQPDAYPEESVDDSSATNGATEQMEGGA